MIEYKTERVSPWNEQSTLNTMYIFGWDLYDKQEVYSESTRAVGATVRSRDSGGGLVGGFIEGYKYGNSTADAHIEMQTAKDVTNYVALTFYRYTEIPNHQELVSLESEYRKRIDAWEYPKKPLKRLLIFLAIFLVTILALASGVSIEKEDIIVLLFFVFMIPYTVFGWVSYFRKKKDYELTDRRLNWIIKRARQLTGR